MSARMTRPHPVPEAGPRHHEREDCRRDRAASGRWVVILLVLAATCVIGPADGSEQFKPVPLAAFTGPDAHPWERVERLVDRHPAFVPENYATPGRQLDPLIRKWFADNPTPPSGQFLLHCAKGYQSRTFPNPVLLVHGAGDNANRAWIHPLHPTDPGRRPDLPGFALALSDLGYSVFAVTFPHNQGDNFLQGEHVANAIRRIRILLNRADDPDFRVDVIAHSKGNVAVQVYCCDLREVFPRKTFLTRFRGDVRRYIAVGSAFRGIDTPFRYYLYNLSIAQQPDKYNAPLGADRLLFYGTWAQWPDRSVYPGGVGCYPGQCQILYNLVRDAKVPLGPESATAADLNVTMNALYHGGTSLFLSSRGIDQAIEAGERLIYRINERGLDPRVQLAVLAGSSRYIAFHWPGYGYVPMPHEMVSPPGDGVIFLASSLYTDGVLRRGAKLIGRETIDLNHLGIACRPKAFEAIDRWLMTK